MTDFERKITSEKALDAAIRQLKTQDDWFLTTKTGLAKRIVTLYDEIIAAADFPVSLPVRDVLNYSSAAFMNYVKLGCNYITRKFNVRHSPTTVYSYGYNYSNEAIHEKLLILTPLMISSLTLFASLCSSSAAITTCTMLLTAKSNLPR